MKRLFLTLPLLTACATGLVAPAFAQESDVFPGFPSCTLAGGHVGLYDDGTDTCKASMTELVGFLDGSFLLLDASNDPITADLELSDGLIVDTTVLVVDEVDDEVGIGIAVPTTKLHLYRNDATADDSLAIEQDGTGDASLEFVLTAGQTFGLGIDNDDGDSFKIDNSGAPFASSEFEVQAAGNLVLAESGGDVGIGEPVPEGLLHLKRTDYGGSGPNATADDLLIEHNLAAGISFLTPNTRSGNIFFGDPESAIVGRLTYAHSTNDMAFWTSGSQRMTIDSSGEVGIGVVDATDKLHIYRNDASADRSFLIEQDGTGDASLEFVLTAGQEFGVGIDNSDGDSFKIDNSGAAFASAELEVQAGGDVLLAESGGDVGVGVAPTTRLHVYRNDATADDSLAIEQDGAGDASLEFVLTAGQAFGMGIDNDDGDSFKIDNSGAPFASAEIEISTGGNIALAESGGDVAIGLAPGGGDGTFHVRTASAGSVTADVNADDAVFENSGPAGISVLAGSGNSAWIYFGIGTDNDAGFIQLTTGGDLVLTSNVASGIISLAAGTGGKTHRFFDDGRFCIIASGGQICEYGKLATAPSTCTVGDTYTDTSPAKCWCSATNTWSVIVGTSCT